MDFPACQPTIRPRHSLCHHRPKRIGKSTLLQVIAGAIQHNEGKIDYYAGPDEQSKVSADLVYHNIAIAAPYLDLVEEMTALEFLAFHAGFKNSRRTMEAYYRKRACPKRRINRSVISSSGMKQRLKLAQAFSVTPPYCCSMSQQATSMKKGATSIIIS